MSVTKRVTLNVMMSCPCDSELYSPSVTSCKNPVLNLTPRHSDKTDLLESSPVIDGSKCKKKDLAVCCCAGVSSNDAKTFRMAEGRLETKRETHRVMDQKRVCTPQPQKLRE